MLKNTQTNTRQVLFSLKLAKKRRKTMKITLIGMSTVGKSYWSEKFVEAGFERIDLDDIIKDMLSAYTSKGETFETMNQWLGMPDEPRYAENEKKFMRLEEDALKYALSILEKKEKNANIIVDTGGSLIYTPPQYWQLLKHYVTVIYLKMDKTIHQTLIDNYLRAPRAMIWNGCFEPKAGETRHETYSRCYATLITEREKLYDIYADYRIDYAVHRDKTMTVERLLAFKGICKK
jgi:shikimate kinase